MDRNINRIGLVNWIALLAATAGMLLVTRHVNSVAGLMAAISRLIAANWAFSATCDLLRITVP